MNVAELLRDSMAAHRKAQTFYRVHDREGAKEQWRKARDLRKQALQEDPERKDPAWDAEQKETPFGRDTNDEMLKFYRSMVGE